MPYQNEKDTKSPNMVNMLMDSVGGNTAQTKGTPKILSIEELEGQLTSPSVPAQQVQVKMTNLKIEEPENDDDFFNEGEDGFENQFAICKENKDATSDDDDDIAFADVDIEQLKKKGSTSALPDKKISSSSVKQEEKEEKIQEKTVKEEIDLKIISVEEIEEKQKQKTDEVEPPIENPPKIPQQLSQSIEINDVSQFSNMNNLNNVSAMTTAVNQQYQYQKELLQKQKELQTQQIINQLNQEEIKNVILHNPELMHQYNLNASHYNFGNHSPDFDLNPFEVLLKDDPTSQWFYRDPQGMIQGPFTCFDMNTWYTQGYFSEDLEISMDYQNFFRLSDLRMYIHNSAQANQPDEHYHHQAHPSQMQGYENMSAGHQMNYGNMYGQPSPNAAYSPYSHGYANATPYSSYAPDHSAYGSGSDHQSYYHVNHMANGGHQNYGPYYGHQ